MGRPKLNLTETEMKERKSIQAKKYMKKYYSKNKDKMKEYYEKYKDKIKENYEKNKDKIKENYEENKAQKRKAASEYYYKKQAKKQKLMMGLYEEGQKVEYLDIGDMTWGPLSPLAGDGAGVGERSEQGAESPSYENNQNMLCRLCVEESTIYVNLYNENCQPNDIYKVCSLYFQEELEKLDTSLTNSYKIVCKTCWHIVKDYDDLRKRVASAQLKLTSLETLEVTIKLEELEIEPIAITNDNLGKQALDEQPVDVFVATSLSEIPNDFKLEVNCRFNQSEDEKSLVNHDTNFRDDVDTDYDEDDDNENDYGDNDEDHEEEEDDDDDEDKPLSEMFRRSSIANEKDIKAFKRRSNRGRPKRLRKDSESIEKKEKSQQTKKTAEHDKFIFDWKEILPCDLCEYTANNFTKLKNHFKTSHEGIKAFVKCCGKKYNERFHLVEHIRIHLDPETFKCPDCGKCSANSRSLSTHIKSVHGPKSEEKPFKCEICFKSFAKKALLQGHMDVHATGQKNHICPHCGKGFVLENRLKIHIRNIHCATCVCEQCGRSFRNPYTLKDHHLQEHQGIQKPKWPCDQCPAQLKSKYNLSYHKRTVHHDGSTLYECSECGKVALNEGALMRHKKNVHEAVRKFKCTICDKAFKVAQVLREHMTIHTGEELYTCPHCPKTFKVSANMHHHRKRVHPKEWAEKRSERPYIPNTDMSHVSQKVLRFNIIDDNEED